MCVCAIAYLALVLVFLGRPAYNVDLRGAEAQCAVHRHVLHGAVGRTDLNVTLQGRDATHTHTHNRSLTCHLCMNMTRVSLVSPCKYSG